MKISRTLFSTIQAGIPSVMKGDYGIGKTTVAKLFSEWLGYKYIRIPLIGAAYEDLAGYPIKVEVNGKYYTQLAPHWWFLQVQENPKSIILFDELNRVDERIQNVVAQILDKSIGQFEIPEECLILATCNDEDIGGINEISYNVLTRAAWFDAEVSQVEERKALIKEYDTVSNFKKLPENWRNYIQEVKLMLAAFHYVRPTAFSKNKNKKIQTSPWPNPRTIHKYCIPALAAALACGYNTAEDIETVITATVGKEFCVEFLTWKSGAGLLPARDFASIIFSGKKYKFDSIGSLLGSLSTLCAFMINELPTSEARKLWTETLVWVFDNYYSQFPEVVSYVTHLFLNLQGKKNEKLTGMLPSKLVRTLKVDIGDIL